MRVSNLDASVGSLPHRAAAPPNQYQLLDPEHPDPACAGVASTFNAMNMCDRMDKVSSFLAMADVG